jgi:hypothetical protein
MSIASAVSKEVIQYYDLVKIEIDYFHNYHITNAPFDIPDPLYPNTINYIAAGGLLQITPFIDNANFSIETMDIQIAGIVELQASGGQTVNDKTALQLMQELDYIDKPVTIYRAFVNQDYDSQGGNRFELTAPGGVFPILYKGFINNMSAGLGAEGDSTTVQIETASHWSDFNRVSSRYTNENSQQLIWPLDRGFEYAKEIQKEIRWAEL